MAGGNTSHLYLATAMFLITVLYLLLRKKAQRDRRNYEIAAIRMVVEANFMLQLESQGLPPNVARSIPVIKYSSGDSSTQGGVDAVCVICLQDFEDGEELRQLPTCSHIFHRACIDQWFNKRDTCPICRVSLLPPPPSRSPASCGSESGVANQNAAEPRSEPRSLVGEAERGGRAEVGQELPQLRTRPTESTTGCSPAVSQPEMPTVSPPSMPAVSQPAMASILISGSEMQQAASRAAGGVGGSGAAADLSRQSGGSHWAIDMR